MKEYVKFDNDAFESLRRIKQAIESDAAYHMGSVTHCTTEHAPSLGLKIQRVMTVNEVMSLMFDGRTRQNSVTTQLRRAVEQGVVCKREAGNGDIVPNMNKYVYQFFPSNHNVRGSARDLLDTIGLTCRNAETRADRLVNAGLAVKNDDGTYSWSRND